MVSPKKLNHYNDALKNMKAMVHSPDGDTNFFGIVARVLQGDILASYKFIICLDYILQTSIDLIKKWFHIKKRQEADDIPQKL